MPNNMYPWASGDEGGTVNMLAGVCPHHCPYCYIADMCKGRPVLQRKYSGAIRLDRNGYEHGLKGKHGTVFMSSMHDLFADAVPEDIIRQILARCKERRFSHLTYLWQTKNPLRFNAFIDRYPKQSIFGTTIESNRSLVVSNAPSVDRRHRAMECLKLKPKMVSIEPIMDFNLDVLVGWMKDIRPAFVSVGADSKNKHLVEPPADKIKALVEALRGFTEVRLKENLVRLAPRLCA